MNERQEGGERTEEERKRRRTREREVKSETD